MNLREILWPAAGTVLLLSVQAAPQAPPPARTGERPAYDVPAEPQRIGRQAGETLYSIGDPRDDEQMYLELINYARADPAGEAQRLAATTNPDILGAYEYFSVDLTKFVADTSTYPIAPPLAFEPRLIQAARGHSQWMLDHGIQAHDQTNPTLTTGQRITASGYPWQRYGESIYAYSEGPEHGHAGFEVDWGYGTGGMQDPPGHRDNNHDVNFREVGIGVIIGNGLTNTGPSAVTIDFAARQTPVPLVTGVAYFDLNSNNRYDQGEGIGGLTVNVSDSDSFALTSASGGFAVPTVNGTRTVTFSGMGLDSTTFNRTVDLGNNVKVDLALPYQGPILTGPAHSPVGQAAIYTFTTVPGATSYRGRVATTSPNPPVYDASNGLAGVTTSLAGTPEPLVDRPGGGQAYHLTHGNGYGEEAMQFDALLRPRANGSLRFLTRLGLATPDQLARVEITTDEGNTWNTVWSQSGSGDAGESGYTQRSVSLASYAGQTLHVRFRYGFTACTECGWYTNTENGAGFHFDSVEFPETDSLSVSAPTEIASGTPFIFTPSTPDTFELSVQPVKSRGTFPFGPPLIMDTSAVAAPTATVTGLVVGPNGKIRVDFVVTGTLTGTPVLLEAPTLTSSYSPSGANLKTNSPTTFSFQYQPTGEHAFLKVSLP